MLIINYCLERIISFMILIDHYLNMLITSDLDDDQSFVLINPLVLIWGNYVGIYS